MKIFQFFVIFVRDMKPGAQSVMTEIGPGCRTGVVNLIMPDLRSADFSDLMIVKDTMDKKWSIISKIFCPSLLMTSA